jgi:alkaline phosphatase D
MTIPPQTSRRNFILRMSTVSAVVAAGGVLSACGGGSDPMVRYDYGVASGDPMSDRAILWTHARIEGHEGDVLLAYEISTDPSFSTLVASGPVTATAAAGHTAKVDATGLAANTEYYYRFRSGNWTSAVGRTRTLPVGAIPEVRMAVFSCANYPAGFFNVYAEAARSDAQYAIHLGDYIYEYAATGYASEQAAQLGRASDPANEILTLADYRRRHAQYRSDVDLRNLHARMPMIAVWDDHEIANDTWRDGAENHTEGAEGSFAARRAAALQAWHEWMPVRTGTDRSRIYRSFNFGNLVSLHMLDTRILARDRQIDVLGLLNPATAAATQAALFSPTRQMLGIEQQTWLQQQMGASAATWQVLGQQVLMGRMEFPVSVLTALNATDTSPAAIAAGQKAVSDYITAKLTPAAQRTAVQTALLNTSTNPKLGYNFDAWDGYPLAREILLSAIAAMNKKLVVLAGDTHNAWHSDLTLAGFLNPAQANMKVGEEFATPSVSSPGFESYLAIPAAQLKSIFENVVDDLNWIDPSRRGYLKMTFTASQARGQWIFVDTISSRNYTTVPPVAAETRLFA